jgi:hypothetical protein
LWLGICQWAAGEPQSAAGTFVRSAQLPGAPAPDPSLLPPELVAAYREAVASPRDQVTCQLDPPLTARNVLVDGKGPTVAQDGIMLAAGMHYLVVNVSCSGGNGRCRSVAAQVGPGGRRSVRLSTAGSCRIRLPARRPASKITCISRSEGRELDLITAVTSGSSAATTLVMEVSQDRMALRVHRQGTPAFQHQLVSNLRDGDEAQEVARRSAKLLLAAPAVTPSAARVPRRSDPDGSPWYSRWWVWAIAGTAAAGIITTAVVAAQDERKTVVIGP